jgi:D-serine deaminase-like pyridoxal phosphate-dependent protein
MALCRYADMMVAVDDPANVQDLSEAAQAFGVKLRVTVEVNVRINRCGVEPGQPAVDLARIVAKSPGLVFAGLMGYEGQIRTPFEERVLETRKAMDKLITSKEAVEKAGLPVKVVSAGGTSTWNITGAIPGITEVESGTYIFMDASYYKHTPDFERALHLLATVISHPRKGRAVTDAGHKALSTDEGLPEVVWPKGAKLVRLAEEHGTLELEGDEAEQLRPGDRVVILPSHGDTTINLHEYYCALRNGVVEAVWPIAGRGRFR